MKLINLTPYLLRIPDIDGKVLELFPEGIAATIEDVSVESVPLRVGEFLIRTSKTRKRRVLGVPKDRKYGTVYVVSRIVFEYFRDNQEEPRDDIYCVSDHGLCGL